MLRRNSRLNEDDDEDESEEEFDSEGINIAGLERRRGRRHGPDDDEFEFGDDDDDSEEDEGHVIPRSESRSMAAAATSASGGSRTQSHQKQVVVETQAGAEGKKAQVLYNQPFDEVLEAGSDSDSESGESDTGTDTRHNKLSAATMAAASTQQSSVAADRQSQSQHYQQQQQQKKPQSPHRYDDITENEESEESDEDENAGESSSIMEYDPNAPEFANLRVPGEIKSLFSFITGYKAHNIDLELQQKPFIPDYIPAVGDLDPFLKVPRPDNREDQLGLNYLDEPKAMQSDPAVVALNLQYMSRNAKSNPVEVIRSIENAETNPKRIMKWVEDIKQLHITKPPPKVNYSKPMPDINQLMQAWPDQFEELLSSIELPSADMDIELENYVRIICALLDIPIHNDNLIQSLHMLFTLYVDFTTNHHFGTQINAL